MAIPFGLGCCASATGDARTRGRRATRRSSLGPLAGRSWCWSSPIWRWRARAAPGWAARSASRVFFALRRPALSRRADRRPRWRSARWPLVAAWLPGRWTAARRARRQAVRAGHARRARRASIRARRWRARGLALWRRTLALYRAHPLAGRRPGELPGALPALRRAGRDARTACCRRRPSRGARTTICSSGWPRPGRSALAALLALYAALGAAAIRRAGARATRSDGRTTPPSGGVRRRLAAFVGCGLTGFPFAMPATRLPVRRGARFAGGRGDARHGRRRRHVAARLARRWPRAALAVGSALRGAGWWSVDRLQASYWLARADTVARRGRRPPPTPSARCRSWRAPREAAPGDFQVALRASYAAAPRRASRPTPSARAERALADRARTRRTPGRRWPARGSTRATRRGAGEAADRALAHPARLPRRALHPRAGGGAPRRRRAAPTTPARAWRRWPPPTATRAVSSTTLAEHARRAAATRAP